MILCGNHKSSKMNLNNADLEKPMGKDVEHGWALPLTIELVQHINNVLIFLIGLVEQFSINYNV